MVAVRGIYSVIAFKPTVAAMAATAHPDHNARLTATGAVKFFS